MCYSLNPIAVLENVMRNAIVSFVSLVVFLAVSVSAFFAVTAYAVVMTNIGLGACLAVGCVAGFMTGIGLACCPKTTALGADLLFGVSVVGFLGGGLLLLLAVGVGFHVSATPGVLTGIAVGIWMSSAGLVSLLLCWLVGFTARKVTGDRAECQYDERHASHG